jgi:hypothetical protein
MVATTALLGYLRRQLLIRGSLRLIHITAARLWALESGTHLWHHPSLGSDEDHLHAGRALLTAIDALNIDLLQGHS